MQRKDINLYRIREDNCKLINTSNSSIYIYKYQDWNQLNVIIIDILKKLGIYDTDIDILRDEYSIKEQYYIASLKDSLGNLYPNIAKEWHPIKMETLLHIMFYQILMIYTIGYALNVGIHIRQW